MFSRDFVDYPTCIQAFETILENTVDAGRFRFFFLKKYTARKANDIIKGFMTMNSDDS